MPNIKKLYNYDLAYNSLTWESQNFYLADVSRFTFTLFESENCDITINWISNENSPYSIIKSELITHVGGTTTSINRNVLSLYCQIIIVIASSPSILQYNVIFFIA
jgi:hypothetical protein